MYSTMRPTGLIILISLAFGLSACTSGGEEAPGSMASRSGSFGVVEVERRADADALGMSTDEAVLGGVFARHEGVEGEKVARLLGVSQMGAEPGRCQLAGREPAVLPDPSAEVKLLDAGSLSVQVAGSRAELAARTFPELGSLVAGAFYAGDARLARARANQDEYRIQTTGGKRVSAFEVVVVAPPGPSGVHVDGAPAERTPTLERDGSDILLSWTAEDPRDQFDIQLMSGGELLECTAPDNGSFRLPGALVGELEPDADARLVLRRVRKQPFDAQGLDAAWVEIAAKRTVTVRVR